MKIKNTFLIPAIALLLAALMVGGSLSGSAADTTAPSYTNVVPTTQQGETADSDETTHPLEYVPTTYPPTSSLEDEINAMVSNNLGGLGQYGDDVREVGGIFGGILTVFTTFIDAIIAFAEKIGQFFAGR